MAKPPKKKPLPDVLVRTLAAAQAQRLYVDDVAFEEAARRRGLTISGRALPPPQKHQALNAPVYEWTDPGDIPARQWIYDRSLIRKFLTVTVAPGGVGKSSLTIVEALALVTGRQLLGKRVEKPSKVWLWNLEDPFDEMQRRIQAACEFYNISADDMGGRLFVSSGRNQPLCLAAMSNNKAQINRKIVDELTHELTRQEIDVLIVDPLISSHAVPENDNVAMDVIAKQWGRIADAANCSVHLVHHTRKLGSDVEVTAESSRGGKALTDAAREVRAINRMSAEDGEKFGVNHRSYFRMYSDKANMAPPAELSDWYEIRNVVLPNGDHVGVVATWTAPDAFSDIDANDLIRVQTQIAAGDWREDVRSPLWAGIAVAAVLNLDIDLQSHKQKVKSLIKTWIGNGALMIETIVDDRRRERRAVRVGRWVE